MRGARETGRGGRLWLRLSRPATSRSSGPADRPTLRRINRLIDAALRDPLAGIVKPEQLRHMLAGPGHVASPRNTASSTSSTGTIGHPPSPMPRRVSRPHKPLGSRFEGANAHLLSDQSVRISVISKRRFRLLVQRDDMVVGCDSALPVPLFGCPSCAECTTASPSTMFPGRYSVVIPRTDVAIRVLLDVVVPIWRKSNSYL
jgi:YoeB-like toxin of bacterial type II toxin-antitoxin system